MKKNKYIFILIVALLIFVPFKTSALTYSKQEYILNSYDINITVNENNTLEITEKIGAYFNVPKHGIFRKIPLRNTVTRLDGTTSKNRVQISNIVVSDNYSLSNENGYKVIKIGDAHYTLTGPKDYEISYLYNLGKDTGKGYDELYFNLIGDEWDTSISNITFTITMPKEFDASKLGFSSGYKGSTDSSSVVFEVNDNVITGRLNKTLNPRQALTIRLELPEGYFVGAGHKLSFMMLISIILPISFVLVAYFWWRKYGKDEQVIETVEFYPPEGLNSLDVGFLYKGKADNKDATSLLIYLANKGYIEISDKQFDPDYEKINLGESSVNRANQKIALLQKQLNEEMEKNPNSAKIKYYQNMLDIYYNIDTPINYDEHGLKKFIYQINKKSKYFIKKIKDYDGHNINELLFLEGLFDDDKKMVTENDLYNNFYRTVNKILVNTNNKKNKQILFEQTASSKNIFVILMIITTYCLITIPPIVNYGEQETIIFGLLFPGIGFSVLFGLLFGKTPCVAKIFGLMWGGMFGGMTWLTMILPALLVEPIYFVIYIIGILCVIVLVILLTIMPKRTKYGNEMLGKLRGFKKFLETAEKEQLEAMVMKYPTYFYDILPYTYVFGISDKWIQQFETISLQAPDWYNSSNSFDVSSFGKFMDKTMVSVTSAMSSSSSSSSGGGSSGGGSSGGGSGGGGGGSW